VGRPAKIDSRPCVHKRFRDIRLKRVLRAVVLVFLLTAAFFSVSPQPKATAYQGRLHADGRWIKDQLGNNVCLMGANIAWRFVYASQYHDYDPLTYADEINSASLNTVKISGANFIRLGLNGWIWYVKRAPKYIEAVDTVISWCKALNIMVVLDNHAPWYDTTSSAVEYRSKYALVTQLTEWKNFMVELAQRYRNEPAVVGFDLLNEPLDYPSNGLDWSTWRTNVLEVARSIHAIDPTYLCFVEPLGSSSQEDDMNGFKTNPLPEPNIVYSAHIYYAWNYPFQEYAINYGKGNFALARQQMEAAYNERALDMLDSGFPAAIMESGVYRDYNKNPNWKVWMNDSLAFCRRREANICWFPFDPDRSDSSLISCLDSDRITLTEVGAIWRTQAQIPPSFTTVTSTVTTSISTSSTSTSHTSTNVVTYMLSTTRTGSTSSITSYRTTTITQISGSVSTTYTTKETLHSTVTSVSTRTLNLTETSTSVATQLSKDGIAVVTRTSSFFVTSGNVVRENITVQNISIQQFFETIISTMVTQICVLTQILQNLLVAETVRDTVVKVDPMTVTTTYSTSTGYSSTSVFTSQSTTVVTTSTLTSTSYQTTTKKATSLTLSYAYLGRGGPHVRFEGCLTEKDTGRPLRNKVIQLTITRASGSETFNLRTDKDGNYDYLYHNLGSFVSATAYFSGDDAYESSSAP